MEKTTPDTLTPYEKYEALIKLTHKPKTKKKLYTLEEILVKLEKLCSAEDTHLLTALRYSRKLLNKQYGK